MTLSKAIVQGINSTIDRARTLGIETSVFVREYEDIALDLRRGQKSWGGGYSPRTAASINKLAVALYYACHPANEMLEWTEADVRAGGGLYDQPGAPLHGLFFDVMSDMLARSGNTALVVLGRHKASLINVMVGRAAGVRGGRMRGDTFAYTRLTPTHDGFFGTGVTTADEALEILADLWRTKSPTADVIRRALYASTSHIPAIQGVSIASKHGELNDDDGVLPFVRHEVGLITGPEKGEVLYAVFTRSPNVVTAKLAEQMIGQIGARVAQTVGGKPGRLAKLLGKTALTPQPARIR